MGVRAEVLELAILGELEEPIHGYELRRRLSEAIGPLRRLSFGSLYPALHRLEAAGYVASHEAPAARGARRLITYTITSAGRDHRASELERVEVDDDSFAVAMGLMAKATPAIQLRLLKARRARVLDRRETRTARTTHHDRAADPWLSARAELESENDDLEITWLDRAIAMVQPPTTAGAASSAAHPGPTELRDATLPTEDARGRAPRSTRSTKRVHSRKTEKDNS